MSVVDKGDLLCVLDSSPTMLDKQATLKAGLLLLVCALTTGVRPDGSSFPRARDINLAVVTTNMGLPGVPEAPRSWQCSGFGDDGILQSARGATWTSPSSEESWSPDMTCAARYPKFVNYSASEGPAGADRAVEEFSCLAQVGPGGCGFEMQLEAALKALTPSTNTAVSFLSDQTGQRAAGHGDGENAGFLRDDRETGPSLIAVVLVTDEEDCSSHTIEHLRPVETAQPAYNDLLYNLRCANFRTTYGALSATWKGLRRCDRTMNTLRCLVPSLVSLKTWWRLANGPGRAVGCTGERCLFDRILADPQMQPRLNDSGCHLENSCSFSDQERGAQPARRIVEVTKGIGPNGVLGSICEDSFAGSPERIIDSVSNHLGQVCLPTGLVRGTGGEVACRVYWELPADPSSGSLLPSGRHDSRFPFLRVPADPRMRSTEDGRENCEVVQ